MLKSKNSITLFNEQFGYHKFSILHSRELFNKTDMDNLLEAIESNKYNYNDIISIEIVGLNEIYDITHLPRKLQVLKIHDTTLQRLTIPKTCTDLREISIKNSNLKAIPKIHFLTKLTNLSIENSNLQSIPSKFPPYIVLINLSGNKLNSENTDLTLFPKNINIILFNNYFTEKANIPGYNFCYGTQGSYSFTPLDI
jgi:hypothetical protein